MEYDITKEYLKIIQNKINMNEFDAALENAKKLTAYFPECAEGYYYQGICYYAIEDYEHSLNNYKKCIELDHNFPKAYYNLGITKYYLGQFKEALNYIEYAYKFFLKANNEEAYKKCLDSIDYIKEEHGL